MSKNINESKQGTRIKILTPNCLSQNKEQERNINS